MAYKNSVAVYIDGINRTANTVMPINWGDFLDERLDELSLSLRAIKKENFAPLTPVEIIFDNELYFGRSASRRTVSRQKATKHYIIANDKVVETRLASGFYNHEMYLIEVTKSAECCIVDTVTFTNDIGRLYASDDTPYAEPIWE